MQLSSPKSASVRPASGHKTSSCPVCSNSKVELYRNDEAERALSSSDLGSSRETVTHGRILRCHACGFGFRAYRPSEEELACLYRDLDPEVYERESSGRLRTARRHLEIVRRFVFSGRLLDVGCASGTFLNCAAEYGFDVVGVEPSSALCTKAQQILLGRGKILCCSLQSSSLPVSSFDVVTLWDVLEHVPDPLDFLRLCASLTKEEGYVLANVPDLDSWQSRILGGRWPLLLAEHLNYFTRRSLALAGKASQLQVICFGRRPASFSLDYVLYRLAQHRFPGAAIGRSLFGRSPLGAVSIPAYLGESYVVWRRSESQGMQA